MNIIYTIIILPIEEIIEFVFCFVYEKIWSLGIPGAIVAVSLVVNFLALPLYNMADALQLKERQIQLKMAPWIKHIKATFKGDEQFMMLNTWYRQNGYHPLYALRSALSILIEIPFFIAAYHFLSHCSLLHNESFLFLKDLGSPDALFKIGNFSVNILPILMTSINIVSSAIYTKGAPLREKIQIYVLALVFLVLLYDSPSGLVFYWILNNTFSLAKNFFTRYKKFGIWCYSAFSAVLILLCLYVAFFRPQTPLNKKLLFWAFCTIAVLPCILIHVLKHIKLPALKVSPRIDFSLLLFSLVALFLLCGLLLPANTISTSPKEFSFIGDTDSPLHYVWSSCLFFAGLFLLWPLVIYKMFGIKTKSWMAPIFFIFSGFSIANALLFKHKYGLISVLFKLDNPGVLKHNSFFLTLGPIIILLFLLFLYFICQKKKFNSIPTLIMVIFCAAEFSLGIFRITQIQKTYSAYAKERNTSLNSSKDSLVRYHLSTTEKNVLILFLDRAASSFFPYIMDQFPELNETFSGFTYYPNCLSFGRPTNYAFPALAGGYEYTPFEINKRDTELLSKKHDEAILVMPRLFSDGGYDTTISRLPYINYDQGITPDYDFTRVVNSEGVDITKFKNEFADELSISKPDYYTEKTCKLFSIMNIFYPPLRSFISNGTDYYYSKLSHSFNTLFLNSFAQLYYMNQAFSFDSSSPTFTFIGNETTHEFMILDENYFPSVISTNNPPAPDCAYDEVTKTSGWHVNVAALIQVGKLLNTLKENNAYDNTRIIIVADHGSEIPMKAFQGFSDAKACNLNPLLLVKDFNASGSYITDNTLLTNAETVNFATMNLNLSSTNPLTGKEFSSMYGAHEIMVTRSGNWNIDSMRNNTQFPELDPIIVKDNIFNPDNWREE